ncbi:MAG: triose-phosphate isomerase [Burkholderiales bacterium]|jgi:triosephosphate isomerase|nr:triose-phosphate isomerase [Burkholderiales bacterium]
MRVKFVAGNWKMNGDRAANEALLTALVPALSALSGIESVVCPPFVYLQQVKSLLGGTKTALGAQDLCQFGNGAYTGGVSAAMLRDAGCSHVIVGHSERRALFGETDDLVAEKFAVARGNGLVPVLCVGETLAERESGTTESVVDRQLQAVLQRCGISAFRGAVLAYEPVWAIGTGKTATPEQAQAVHAFIRSRLAGADAKVAAEVRIVYGGSVKAANAAQLFAMADIDGGLIGGAALVAEEFAAICRAAAQKH